MHMWKVVPLSKGQLKDVRTEDVLENGLYRKCNTYRGGGGYDQFPVVCKSLYGKAYNEQFVVQLQGCNMDCPYCYVTRAGVWGEATRVSTADLVKAFIESKLPVFHLMGGAPALQMKFWPELLKELSGTGCIFHSDLMLSEGVYDESVLDQIDQANSLLAVNIKGTNDNEWRNNTRKEPNWPLLWDNFYKICNRLHRFYITYTGCNADGILAFEAECERRGIRIKDMYRYNIELIEYGAAPHVDETPWGVN